MLCLGTFYPFVYNKFLFGDKNTIMTLGFIGVWILYMMSFGNKSKVRFVNKQFVIICLVQVSCFLIFALFFQSSSYLYVIINIGLSLFFIFLLINTIEPNDWLKYFIKFNIILLVLSAIGVVLLSSGYLRPIGEPFIAHDRTFLNYGFFFMNFSGRDFMRQSGYYDEPGSFAYIVMFLLLLNRKFFKNQIWEYALLILTLFTASLAHIFTSLAYIALFIFSIKRINYFIVTVITIVILVFIMEEYSSENGQINFLRKMTIGRVEHIYLTGEETGSRDEGYKIGTIIFKNHPFGMPREEVKEQYPDFIQETIWGPFIYYGIFGIPFFFLPFIYVLYRSIIIRKNIIDFKCWLIIVLNLLQRPFYTYPLFMICIYFLFFNAQGKNVMVTKKSEIQ